MRELGRYDTSLQMFVRPMQECDIGHLIMLRKQAEKGRFGPLPLSQPRGDYLFKMPPSEIVRYAIQQTREEALRSHIINNGGY